MRTWSLASKILRALGNYCGIIEAPEPRLFRKKNEVSRVTKYRGLREIIAELLRPRTPV